MMKHGLQDQKYESMLRKNSGLLSVMETDGPKKTGRRSRAILQKS